VRLPGLPGSAEYMTAYQEALGARQVPIGGKRTKPGLLVIGARYADFPAR
jgi:hypothetical protein